MTWLGYVAIFLVLAGVVLIGWGAYEEKKNNQQETDSEETQ